MNITIEITDIPRADGTTASCRLSTVSEGHDAETCIDRLQQAVCDCLRALSTMPTVLDAAATQRMQHPESGVRSDEPVAANGTPRRATTKQIAAIGAMARRSGLDALQLAREQFGVHDVGELSIRQASRLIDQLKGRQVAT